MTPQGSPSLRVLFHCISFLLSTYLFLGLSSLASWVSLPALLLSPQLSLLPVKPLILRTLSGHMGPPAGQHRPFANLPSIHTFLGPAGCGTDAWATALGSGTWARRRPELSCSSPHNERTGFREIVCMRTFGVMCRMAWKSPGSPLPPL